MITRIIQAIIVDNTTPYLNKAELEKILNLADHESEREVQQNPAFEKVDFKKVRHCFSEKKSDLMRKCLV